MHNPNFYSINSKGEKVLRNLEKHNAEGNFSLETFRNIDSGFDDLNYMYYENFQMYEMFDSIGSDYERYGCVIEKGDVVVDIGANIGMFTRRAIEKGASRIVSFEPMSLSYSCLVDNVGFQAECHKIAVTSKLESMNFVIPDTLSNLGGGSNENFIENREIAKKEICLGLGMEDLWSIGLLPNKIDFMKIDCEGGEIEIIPQLTNERLQNIQKISMEYHACLLGHSLREEFTERAASQGFNHFTLFHGDGGLVQLHLWK